MGPHASQIDQQAASWVQRARAGDQIAQACLVGVQRGAKEEAKRNVPPSRRKYQRYFDAAMAAAHAKAPRKWWSIFGREKSDGTAPTKRPAKKPHLSLVHSAASDESRMDAATARRAQSVRMDGMLAGHNPEASKPTLPDGSLNGIFDRDAFVRTVLNACQYQHGLDAAAVVLSTGPVLDHEQMSLIGMSDFGSDEASAVFFNGIQFPDPHDYHAIAGKLDPAMRQCLAVGQCVGRARRIQAIRNPGVRLGGPVGWEFGE